MVYSTNISVLINNLNNSMSKSYKNMVILIDIDYISFYFSLILFNYAAAADMEVLKLYFLVAMKKPECALDI